MSVILPVFNGEAYIRTSIQSVIEQSHQDWELLVINDGSTDGTKEAIHSFSDKRIRYFEHANEGVSTSRNVGLANMRGDFFCFLDADDTLPKNSLASRYEVFAGDLTTEFVDGRVEIVDLATRASLRTYVPSFVGAPFARLLRVDESCFCGLTWMIRKLPGKKYQMAGGLTHCEDLLFFLDLSRGGGLFRFTEECVLLYRRRAGSAMSDVSGLDKGYSYIFKQLKNWPEVSSAARLTFWLITRKIMFLSYLFNAKSPWKAIRSLIG